MSIDFEKPYGILHVLSGELVYFAQPGTGTEYIAWIPTVSTSVRYDYIITTIKETAALFEMDESEFEYVQLQDNQKDITKTLVLED